MLFETVIYLLIYRCHKPTYFIVIKFHSVQTSQREQYHQTAETEETVSTS
jgi:hypothetical protein